MVVALKVKNIKISATSKTSNELGAPQVYIRETDWLREQYAQVNHYLELLNKASQGQLKQLDKHHITH